MSVRQLNQKGLLKSLREKNRHSLAMSIHEECKHNKFDYIMDCLFTDITSIDFNAFSMQDIDDLLKHVYSIPINDGFNDSRQVIKTGYNNYFFMNERVKYAIQRLASNPNKKYESTDDFI